MEKKEKLMRLAGGATSGWLEEAEKRQQESDWRQKSSEIALVVLLTMRKQRLSQKVVAARMGVSAQYFNKLVKGGENLTLETVCKLEVALGVSLIEVIQVKREPRLLALLPKLRNLEAKGQRYVRRSALQAIRTTVGTVAGDLNHAWRA